MTVASLKVQVNYESKPEVVEEAATNTTEAASDKANTDQEMLNAESEAAFNDDEPMVIEEAVAGELTSNSSREAFVSYLEEKYPALVILFPADSTVVDLFEQVENKKAIEQTGYRL